MLLISSLGYSQANQIQINVPLRISIDPVSKGGSAFLELHNTSSSPAQLSLQASDFVSLTTDRLLGAKTTFSDETATAAKPTYTKTLPAGDHVLVKVDVANVSEAGESKAVIYNGSVPLGPMTAINDRFPFNVTVVSSSGQSEIRVVSGVPVSLTFKNADPFSYPVRWKMRVKGKTFEYPYTLKLPPNGAAFVDFVPPKEWLPSPLATIFKDQEQEGEVLIISSYDTVSSSPFPQTKAIPIKLHLAYLSDVTNQIIGYPLVFLILVLGGVTSLVITFGLPNRLQRLNLKDKIETVSRTISAISRSVDSRLRVLLRVERKRLADLLASRSAYSPDLTDVFAQTEAGIASLSAKVDVVNQLDLLRQKLADLASKCLGPTVIDKVDTILQQGADLLRKPQVSAADIEAARASLTKAEELLTTRGITQGTPQELANRAKAAAASLSTLRDSDACKKLEQRFAHYFRAITEQYQDPANIHEEDYGFLDDALSRLQLLKHFLEKGHQVTGTSGSTDAEERFLKELEREGWYGFRSAPLFLRELEQKVYAEGLSQALQDNPKSASIEVNRTPRQNEPLEFTLVFHDPNLNGAAAREEWRYKWSFGDNLQEDTTWTVWHYYRQDGKFRASVIFEDLHGNAIVDTNGKLVEIAKDVQVERQSKTFFGERAKIELMKLAIALVAAGIGLIAGARDQLLKLDLVPGLIAVFLAGFGADTIKNLIKK